MARRRSTLNPLQEELLRRVAEADLAIPKSEVDGRVLRPLLRQKLLQQVNGYLLPTPAGRTQLGMGAAERTASLRGVDTRALRNAIGGLERALPATAVVRVGECAASPAQLIDGLRALADRIDAGA